ncbi:hypothetical protein [Amycolatopsis sp. CA-230715]|uniref:hypothetical protein n=1 Tax=Amycolatopsis sp. CA-230715 TaxID=2745196 RepID=UPI001C0112B7|nr:hypothetical protein [Amycolatopsis sp. CA-230715]
MSDPRRPRRRPRRPDQDDCRPTCRNLAYTDRDIAALRQQATELESILGDFLAPSPRHQRIAILHAADRLLASSPQGSTGNLSTVQLAVEADVKYWVVAQKHPDLRDQHAARHASVTPFRTSHKAEE